MKNNQQSIDGFTPRRRVNSLSQENVTGACFENHKTREKSA